MCEVNYHTNLFKGHYSCQDNVEYHEKKIFPADTLLFAELSVKKYTQKADEDKNRKYKPTEALSKTTTPV